MTTFAKFVLASAALFLFRAPAEEPTAPEAKKPAPAPAEDPHNAEARTKLQRKVTFEFVDTPLEEAVAFLRSLAGVKMTLAPEVAQDAKTSINLRVTDMSMDLALEWILKLADLDYRIVDGAILIAKPKPAAAPKAGAAEPEPWVAETRKKLARKVSFEFVDTPLEDALQFLNSLTKVNIILDPKAGAEGKDKTPITLRVQDIEMGEALKSLLGLAGMKYDFRNQAVFITRDDKAAQPKPAPAPKP